MKYCSNVKYIYRVNDDVFVDQVFIAATLNNTYAGVKRSIMGIILNRNIINRKLFSRKCELLNGKECIAPNDYSHLKLYPQYIHGGFYVLTRDVLEYIYSISLRIDHISLDWRCIYNRFCSGRIGKYQINQLVQPYNKNIK